MTEPRRWKDSPDAPIGMRELLSSARPTRPIDDRALHRGASRVAKLGVAPAAAAAAVGIWTKLAAAGVVGLAAVGTVVAARSHDAPVAHAPPVTAPAIATAVTPAPPPLPLPSPPPMIEPPPPALPAPPPARVLAPAPAPTPAPAPPAPAPVPESTLSAELSLLEDARAALARDPERALAVLASHRRRYGEGALAAERDLMELDALRRAGRTDEAHARATAWLARDPAGLHSTRVRAILATLEGR